MSAVSLRGGVLAVTATKERLGVQKRWNSSVRVSHNLGWHRPTQFVTKLGGCPPSKQRTSLFLKRLAKTPQVVGLLREEPWEHTIKFPAFQHRVSVSITFSTSNSAGKRSNLVVPCCGSEAVSTVSWKGPQAGHGPSRPPGSCWIEDSGTGHSRVFCTSRHHHATCSCQDFCPFWLHLSLPASPCTPFPLVLDSRPHSHLHVPGQDHAAPLLCSLTPSLAPVFSHLSILVCLCSTWNFLV